MDYYSRSEDTTAVFILAVFSVILIVLLIVVIMVYETDDYSLLLECQQKFNVYECEKVEAYYKPTGN